MTRASQIAFATIPSVIAAAVSWIGEDRVGFTLPFWMAPIIFLLFLTAAVSWGVARQGHHLALQRLPKVRFRLVESSGDTNPEASVSVRGLSQPIYRIRVENFTDVTVTNVAVFLDEVAGVRFSDLPAPLQLGVSNSETVNLRPGQSEYVNIAFFDGDLSDSDAKRQKITFCTTDRRPRLSVPLGQYEAKLRALADNITPVPSTFRVSVRANALSYPSNLEWVSGWDEEVEKALRSPNPNSKPAGY